MILSVENADMKLIFVNLPMDIKQLFFTFKQYNTRTMQIKFTKMYIVQRTLQCTVPNMYIVQRTLQCTVSNNELNSILLCTVKLYI